MQENMLYDQWNKVKKTIANIHTKTCYPKPGEVWVVNLGFNLGYEQNGKGLDFTRPVLVVKKVHNKLLWVLPMSTKQKSLDFYFNFTDPKGMPASVITSQIRAISILRFKRKLYSCNRNVYALINNKIGGIY